MTAPANARVATLESRSPVHSEAPTSANPVPALARLVVLGASGYSGQEFVRLALGHPGLSIVALGSREPNGAAAGALIAGLDAHAGRALPPVLAPDALPALFEADTADTLVSCLPHGVLREWFARHPALAGAARIMDLSSDHRDGRDGFVYGLPEQDRAAVASAARIANPGCYATAAALALLPAAEAGWLAGPITISALSGVSGAGRAADLRTSFAELDGGAALYKAGEQHAHLPEMTRTLARAGCDAAIAFAPQLVPMTRGILLTAWASLREPGSTEAVHAAYAARWADEPFVRMLPTGAWPETRAVKHSNRCDLAVITVHGGRTLMVAAALDNLVKGAAGQALQNLNLMTGWPEAAGLPADGRPW